MALDARIEWLASVDSTNSEALRRADQGESGPVWIAAAEQFEGRGRRGRRWESGRGDLAATLLFEPGAWRRGATPIEVATLSYVAALSVADMIEDLHIRSAPRLKWPNDVLLGGAKVAGVLLEARGAALAIGVGVNLVNAPMNPGRATPSAPVVPAAALGAFTGDLDALRPERVLEMTARRFDERFEAWRVGGFAAIRGHWLERAERLRGEVAARLPHETVEGRFADVDHDGALILETALGRRRIHAADVYWPAAE